LTASPGDGNGRAPAVWTRGLAKHYEEVEAVRGIDFEVRPGEIFGFLGPNGAGKSTTIGMLCTLIRPTGGTAGVAGHDVVAERNEVRRNIGLVFQEPTLDIYLTAEQNLRFHAELYGVPRALARERIARGLLHSPRVLFLDEPTVGLDPQTRSSIWTYIKELKRQEEITIFLTTHYMDEAEYCDRIAIIDHGEIVVLDTPESLKASVGKDRVQIGTDDDAAAIEALRERFRIEAVIAEGQVMFSVPEGEQFVPRLFEGLGVPIRSVSVARPSLDDVFMSYTGTTIRDAEAAGPDPFRQMAARMRRR
jgi:ABC-2 type transport system ATP-binding protein